VDLFDRGARAFRHRLKRELPKWRAEGLVDERAESILFERYQLGEEGVSLAAAAIYTLGALLIGGGIISFVAWNWADLARPAKLAILGGALVLAHGGGWWMWRVADVMPRLGHALTLLGTLIFGGSIGLVAQMYQIAEDPAAGFGLWALGAAVAAWALRSTPNAAFGAAIAGVWGCTFLSEHKEMFGLVPWAVGAVFLPLAWVLRSRVQFVAAALATGIVMTVAAAVEVDEGSGFALGGLAAAAPLLAFSLAPRFRSAATVLGLLTATLVFYLASFREIAEEFGFADVDLGAQSLWFIAPAFLGAVALLVRYRGGWRGRPATLCALGGIPLVLLGLAAGNDGLYGVIASNLVLAVVAAVAITSAAHSLNRVHFWYGSLLGGLLIVSRFLEFDTELWLKAIVFIVCGMAVIAFGVAFERRRTRAA
jgi:uncharacterized membrane protein